ncbi:MAG: insecticidal toxin protein [Thermoanaerobaculia bacterium]
MGKSFHQYYDEQISQSTAVTLADWASLAGKQVTTRTRALSYLFSTHFHPYAGRLVRRLIEKSVPGLQAMDTEYVKKPDGTVVPLPDGKPRPVFYEDFFAQYVPSGMVEQPHPVKDLDFTSRGAYSVYNWELFYHVPITIAIHLSKNQRFADALRWFHYVFDPTDNSQGPTPERFWKVKPFQTTDVKRIEEILVNLATGADPALRQETIDNINAWKDAPFRPHVVARYRQSAYMFKTVMAYLDNLIAWGDSLFRQDTGETINEAQQLYVLAANILGPRPQAVPKKGTLRPQTYANFKSDLDAFGNALVEFEGDIAFDLSPHPGDPADGGEINALRSIGNALYFCIPRNDKLLGYWDTVADRLFKIRNSLNIQGIFRQLPLFEPPIDPALLARAAASGLDVAAIVGGLNQPLPLVRFQLLLQKAAEICQEVKSLGNNLLAAIEKEDNEALAILRARHERVILGLVEAVRYAQLQETAKAREGLEQTLVNAVQRFTYYEMQLGRQENEIEIPELDGLDTDSLYKMKLRQGEPALKPRSIEVDITSDTQGISEGKKISSYEVQELELLQKARERYDAAVMSDLLGSEMALIPEFGAQAQPMGAGAAVKFGGMFLAKMFSMMAMVERATADQLTYQAGKSARIGSYARREQEWAFQSNLAAGEITQLFKQLRAAQIREAVAAREWTNHQQQMRHAAEIERFLTQEKNGKTSSRAFYAWLRREVKGLYSQCFQLAFDVARKAERALQHELGDPGLSFLQYGYLSGKEGLLAGEKLHLDIKRMEMAYHDLNQREYELTRHVSLLQLNPKALLQLRTVGRCTVFLPEEVFDLDCPGHYFRRLKSVALSIPCVAGPYSSVSCTLTLLKSSIRRNSLPSGDGYARAGADDSRFSDHFGSLQSIVTSTGQNDSGLFETNLRDERYLPFEGSGAISEWQLELPAGVRQFNYDTISDVILHLRYTAREGGALLRNAAVGNLKACIEEAQAMGSVRLFSVRHEFPGEWAKLKSGTLSNNPPLRPALTLALREEHYPFWSRGSLEAIKRVDVYARTAKTSVEITALADGSGLKDSLVPDASLGNLRVGKLDNLPLPQPIGSLTLYFNDLTMTDLWLGLAWGKE